MCAMCGCSRAHVGHDRIDDGGPREASARHEGHAPSELGEREEQLARATRAWLFERGIVAFNIVGAAGAGKTALLEATVGRIYDRMPVAVLEGDQESERDAERIRAAGCPVMPIRTGAACHIDALAVAHALQRLEPVNGSLLFVENVGNLICPPRFDIGERAKVVVLAVTEGEELPLKHPQAFRAAEVVVLSKVDLLPHVRFDVPRCFANALRVNPRLRTFEVSASSGEGVDAWCAWLSSVSTLAPTAPTGARI